MTKEIMLEPTNYNDHLSTLHLVSHQNHLLWNVESRKLRLCCDYLEHFQLFVTLLMV